MNYNIVGEEIKAGIYKITNITNGKCYIGQSVNVFDRIRKHKNSLARGVHHNKILQIVYDKLGEKHFSFDVLEECSIEELNDKEIMWIAFFDSTNRKLGYNFESGGKAGKNMHQDTKDTIMLANRGNNSLLSETDVAYIKQALVDGKSQGELSKEYNVHFSTISKIKKCANWSWVMEELNEELTIRNVALKEANITKAKELYDKGYSCKEIAEVVDYSCHYIQKMFGGDRMKTLKEEYATRRKSIEDSFLNGDTKSETMELLGISESIYNKRTKRVREEKEKKDAEQINILREQGMLVKDIAVMMGMHRTTVSNLTRKTKEKMKQQKVLAKS